MNTDINNLNRSNPFKTPEGYFPDLESAILLKTTGKAQDINPFKTPDFYFEQLEAAIISKTENAKEEKKGKLISLFSQKSYWISAAACLFFAVMIGIYTFTDTDKTPLAVTHTEKAMSVIDELYVSDFDNNIADSDLDIQTEEPVNLYVSQSKAGTSPKEVKYDEFTQKTSEVIYSLYFDDEDTAAVDNMEDEFFL